MDYAEAGIAEYWIADPSAETIEVLTLHDDAQSPLLPGWPPTWLHVLTPRRSELEFGLIHRRRLSLSPGGQPGTGPHRSGVSTCLNSTAPRHC